MLKIWKVGQKILSLGIIKKVKEMYNNPENIGPIEILRKMRANMSFGPNRNKRFKILNEYSVNIISTEEWIERYCIK